MMIPPYQLLLFLTALASPSHSLALNPTSDLSPIHHVLNLTTAPPTTNTSSPRTPPPPINSEAHCHTNPTPFHRRKPRFSDCGAAIRQLPSSHVIGTFRTGGPADQFRLPVIKHSGTCSVEVGMQSGFGAGESGTWLAIGAAATQLNMACVNTFTFPVRVGGWTTTGSREGIRVTLRFSGPRDGEEWL